MSYGKLYEYCQTLDVPVSRASIKDKACELTGLGPVKLFRDGLNTDLVRGYYVSSKNLSHQFVRQSGGSTVIVHARGLNPCWERFVVVKELMHLFDDPLHSLGTSAELEQILAGFASGLVGRSKVMQSEVDAFWMALAVLCPEPIRQDYQRQLTNMQTNFNAIANALRIPEQYVPHLFISDFKEIVGSLIL